jgi:hypothetical protein
MRNSVTSSSYFVELPYDQYNVPCQVILSQVCTKWRQATLRAGALLSQKLISTMHAAFSTTGRELTELVLIH